MNSTNSTIQTQSPYAVFIMAPFAIIAIIVNILFFILGLKRLKRKAHNMFVISMCGGDCLHGVSLFILVFLNRIREDVFAELCFSSMMFYFISLSLTLTISLLICVERYVAVKLKNYGVLTQSESWKKKMAAIALSCSTGYVIICMLVVPRRKVKSSICYLEIFYNPYHYKVILFLLSGLFVCLAVTVIVIYILIVYFLLVLIYQGRRVSPPASTVRLDDQPKMLGNIHGERTRPLDMKLFQVSGPSNTVEALELESTLSCSGEGSIHSLVTFDDQTQPEKSITSVCNINVEFQDFHLRQTQSNRSEFECSDESQSSSTENRQCNDIEAKSKVDRKPRKNKKRVLACKQWEMRALATSVVIIGSTSLLLGPVTVLLILDALDITFSKGLGDCAAMLVAIHSVLNPFLYAYRFKELRDALKNIMCCRKVDLDSNHVSFVQQGVTESKGIKIAKGQNQQGNPEQRANDACKLL